VSLRVYIASPYTLGDPVVNVRTSLQAANALMELGYHPYAPLLSHFQHFLHPRPYEDWMRLDLAYLAVCQAVLRLPGRSKGAERECRLARFLKIPIYASIAELEAAR